MKELNQLVSIGMPVFNDVLFIEQSIESILSQSYSNFELILSDDCSTDGSNEICLKYEKIDKRVKYIRQPFNIGISKNMKFLLGAAKGEYFMWAGNDDLWDKDFIKILKKKLDENKNLVMAFSIFTMIDENNAFVKNREYIVEDYTASSEIERLKKFILKFSDGCGYGLFRRQLIKDVEFPVWWWINQKCAYNNIYPTICFYLAKGEYYLHKDSVLWYNRVKNAKNVNHSIPYKENFIRGYFAFCLRKINLLYVSLKNILRANGSVKLVFKIALPMTYHWFLLPCFNEMKHSLSMLYLRKYNIW